MDFWIHEGRFKKVFAAAALKPVIDNIA